MAAADAVSPVPFFAFPFLWLQITLFIQQSIVGFDEFMKVQAGRARRADVFVVINQKCLFLLAVWHHSTSHVIHREENTLNGLVGTRKRSRKLKCTSRSIASYSMSLDVKVSTIDGYIVSVPVPRIRDVSLLCYRFQSERITETAKRSNVDNYLDISK